MTRLVHGPAGLQAAQQATRILFGEEIANLSDEQLADIFADVPSTTCTWQQLDGTGLGILEALSTCGLATSNGDARRAIEQGGVYVNNRRVNDQDLRLTRQDLASQSVLVLRRGKKRYALVRFC